MSDQFDVERWLETTPNYMKDAMSKVVSMAAKENRVCYLYFVRGEFFASYLHWHDWLFKAYPGGRKQLSVIGTEKLHASN